MLRTLTFLNPPRRRSSMRVRRSRMGRFVRRGSSPRRRVRRNPPKMTPTMRRKVSLGVRRALAAKRAGRSTRRRSAPRAAVVVRRSRPRRRSTMALAVRRSYSAPARRSFRRRRSGLVRSSGGFGLKSLISKDNLTVAGGAIGAGILTTIVLGRFGNVLPMSNQPIGVIVYRAVIPLGGAYLLRRVNPRLAQGFLLGGIILALNEVVRQYVPQIGALANSAAAPAVAGAGEYLGGLPGAYRGMPNMNANYDATSAFGAAPPSVYDSEPAFPNSAWG